MKRLFLIASIMLAGVFVRVQAQALQGSEPITFHVGIDNEKDILGEVPRMPIRPLKGTLDDHTLYLHGVHSGYTLYLIDTCGDEPNVVYQVVIPAGVNIVVLPATFSGTYELQLHNSGAYYFYTEVQL